ncbi:MAG: prepilin-type N-terminal cleavage/methylation domain-containing protein [Candidatus Omnitrophica bacterium]|nr:prepilin-type N-terminal cleavage/methylation domain-containing protein [Candidatus Omnitrophota bacterium]
MISTGCRPRIADWRSRNGNAPAFALNPPSPGRFPNPKSQIPNPKSQILNPKSPAFTLLELLIVLGIIGMLAALGLPALKGIGQSNTIGAANRQLLDDLSLARMLAINGRSTVYMVFVRDNPLNQISLLAGPDYVKERKLLTNLVSGQFTAYALYTARSMGDQPGREYPRYLTAWRYLPDGIFIATNKFFRVQTVSNISLSQSPRSGVTIKPFAEGWFPFPTAQGPPFRLYYVAFNAQGQLVPPPNGDPQDGVIPLARGSIFYPKDAQDAYLNQPADLQENPPGNSLDPSSYDFIYISWLTGRARVEKRTVQ